jgi:hypothetical protein
LTAESVNLGREGNESRSDVISLARAMAEPDMGVRRYRVIETCANPECGKILHYLREGRILTFAIVELRRDAGGVQRRVEHYWLCGRCSSLFTLKREGEVISLVIRPSVFVSNANDNRAF